MSNAFNRNFNLLTIGRFLQEMIFWYSIFIAFAYFIDMSIQQITYAVVATNLGIIVFETPSGVLADRWSRKWTLALGTGVLILASLVIGLSTGAYQYIVGSFLWGIFFALQSGTPDSLIYDLLKKDKKTNLYKKYLARYALLGTAGLIIGSIAGGFIAGAISLRAAYLLTIIPSVLSLIPLIMVDEPTDHHAEQDYSSRAHYKVALKSLLLSKQLLIIVVALVFITAALSFTFELNQVYYYAAGLPLVLYGVVNASAQLSVGVGAWLAHLKSNKSAILMVATTILILAFNVLFSLTIISAILLSVLLLGFYYLTAVLGHYVQDNIGSGVRAAANSMINTGGRLVFTGMILLFGVINSSKEEVNGFVILAVVVLLIYILVLLGLSALSSFDNTQRKLN